MCIIKLLSYLLRSIYFPSSNSTSHEFILRTPSLVLLSDLFSFEKVPLLVPIKDVRKTAEIIAKYMIQNSHKIYLISRLDIKYYEF